MVDILRHNFEGFKDDKQQMIECPKYGNDIDSVDKKAKELTELLVQTTHGYKISTERDKIQVGFYTSFAVHLRCKAG